jgi:tripartite-type tricarboxylate transporter receptor subunit TctC
MNGRCILLATATLLGAALPAIAQTDYPAKPVSLVVPFSAGGRTDVIGRIVAQHLQTALGKPIAVVNKPGASSVLGANEVAEAKPDGYSLGFFSTSAVTAQYTVPTPMSLKNYELIAIVNSDPAAIAVADKAPWQTLKDLVDDARTKPGQLKIGMIPGASAQIFAAGFARAAGIDLINVPFKGDSEGAIALAGGHIEIHVAVPVAYKSLVDGKKVRVLAVAADARSPLYGNAPTFRENGVDLTIGAFHGVFAPKGTPAAVVKKVADALEAALGSRELNERMNDVGAAVLFLRGAQAQAYLDNQDKSYSAIIEALGLRVAKAP